MNKFIISFCIVLSVQACSNNEDNIEPKTEYKEEWQLVWSDDFEYSNESLDEKWISQNKSSFHILSSRWRENVEIDNGILHLKNKKESRGGQDWTSGSIWTKDQFKYGKFECRYKYGASTGLNNSFWIFRINEDPNFEIDINEGKYPNRIDTNIHDTSNTYVENGETTHPVYPVKLNYQDGLKAGYNIQLEDEIVTQKIRLTSANVPHFHIRELKIYSKKLFYPDVLSDDTSDSNQALKAKVSVSGTYPGDVNLRKAENAIDGLISTSWVSQKNGDKTYELEWTNPIKLGCVQLVNGWQSNDTWMDLMTDFNLEYWNGESWESFYEKKVDDVDLSKEFHVYAFEWNKENLIWFLDGLEIRRMPNDFCHDSAAVYLSSAVIEDVEEIDGTSMQIDWVKIYKKE